MSNGEELFVLRDDATSRPTFEVALRGYERRQVDRYVEQVDSEISTLTTERERAFGQIHGLTAQLQQLQVELVELSQRPAQVDRASFRDLGPMVDQILALAEKQAEAITDAARERAAELQGEAEKTLVEAREQAAQWQADVERELNERRTAAEQDLAERRTALERELDHQRNLAEQNAAALIERAQQHSTDVRQHAEEQVSLHQQQLAGVQQEIGEQQQTLSKLQGDVDAATQRLTQLRQEEATSDRELTDLQHRLGDVRQELTDEINRLEKARRSAESAERHAKEVRAKVQREAKRVADMAAAAVMAAAAGGAETAEYPMVARPPAGPSPAVNEAADPAGGQH